MKETCPLIHINKVHLPQKEDVKYFGLHLNRRLTWHKHIYIKWKLRCKSKLSTSNKLLTIKRSSNQSGLTEYNSGVQLPLPT
jgi:hypothetical protein